LERIDFPELARALNRVGKTLGLSRLYVLLDEWAAVPRDLQPLLAEFLRRSFFTNSWITVKIGAVEYHSRFYESDQERSIGIQPGSDVAAALHLDDYLVYDRAPEHVRMLFRDILYKHISVELGWDSFRSALRSMFEQSTGSQGASGGSVVSSVGGWFAGLFGPGAAESLLEKLENSDRAGVYIDQFGPEVMKREIGVDSPDQLARALFSPPSRRRKGTSSVGWQPSRDPFVELVRAAEGVPRDFIQIFNRAFFGARRQQQAPRINVNAVVEAASKWYFGEKATAVQGCAAEVLGRIAREVLGARKARRFLVPGELEDNSILRSLVDLRVVHLVQRGYPDPKNPAVTYSVYSLDYGTYVHLIGTASEPADADPAPEDDGGGAPIGVRRSSTNVVLTEQHLRCTDGRS
jgi:hypothetical protein